MERAIFSTGVRKYRIGTADQKVAAPPLFVLGRDVEIINGVFSKIDPGSEEVYFLFNSTRVSGCRELRDTGASTGNSGLIDIMVSLSTSTTFWAKGHWGPYEQHCHRTNIFLD